MEFSVKSGSPEKQRSACVVVGVFEPRRLSPVAEQLDKISDGYISSLLRRGDLEGKPGQMLLLHQVPGVLSERVLLVGCGKERELDERQYKQIINKTITTLNETGSMEAVCFLTELHVKGRDTYWKVRQAVETTKAGLYSFDQFKTNKAEPRRPLRKLVFNVPTRRELTIGEKAISHGLAVAKGVRVCRDVANMPPNICNPAYLASQARRLADAFDNITYDIRLYGFTPRDIHERLDIHDEHDIQLVIHQHCHDYATRCARRIWRCCCWHSIQHQMHVPHWWR